MIYYDIKIYYNIYRYIMKASEQDYFGTNDCKRKQKKNCLHYNSL